MYDRSPRKLTQESKTTSEDLGPGAYIHIRPKERRQGYAPFASIESRKTFLENHNPDIPGPGQYVPIGSLNPCKGSSFASNNNDRFSDPKHEVPGPGAYSVASSLARQSNISCVHRNDNRQQSAAKGILWVRKQSAPSVPTKEQSYGYEEDDGGSLILQTAPPREPPPKEQLGMQVSDNKGTNFWRSRSKRLEFIGREGPGPGTYNISNNSFIDFSESEEENATNATQQQMFSGQQVTHTAAASGTEDLAAAHGGSSTAALRQRGIPSNKHKPLPSFQSKLQRYHELLPARENKKGVPGPGSYSIVDQFARNAPPIEFQFFGSTSKRSIDISPSDYMAPDQMKTPGPGTYDDPRCAFRVHAEQGRLKVSRKPFGTSADRFAVRDKEVPGPGSYRAEEATSLSTNVNQRSFGRYNVFGSTASRFVPRKQSSVPGPGHYEVTKPIDQRKSSSFASQSSRIQCCSLGDGPPPGTYDTSQSYARSQGKTSMHRGSQQRVSFLSCSRRNSSPCSNFAGMTNKTTPGPGSYELNVEGAARKAGGTFVSKSQRFEKCRSDVPGPGTYKVPVDITLNKRSHNITLQDGLWA